MTGKFAYVVVCQYIESITLSKLVLKKLSKENKDYKVLYKKVNEAQSALLKEVLDTVEYEEESKLTDFSEDVETFKRKIIQRITTRMISSIAKQDISEIMQCKKDMVPFISSTIPWLIDEFENNIETIITNIQSITKKRKLLL